MGSKIKEIHPGVQNRGHSPMLGDRCRHCRHNPASPRIFGYCSWDCHDSDGDDGGDGDADEGKEAA